MSYTRETTELLLPLVWDSDASWGIQRDDTPDPDMPKGYVNPAHSNTLSAYLVDIESGWRRAPLTHKERRAVLLRFGVDMEQNEIARHESNSKSTISTRLFTAVGKIAANMNGTIFTEDETE